MVGDVKKSDAKEKWCIKSDENRIIWICLRLHIIIINLQQFTLIATVKNGDVKVSDAIG